MPRPLYIGVWPGALLAACLGVGGGPAQAAAPPAWSESLYNPNPLPDDVLLPLPCGGAMAFRAVATPAPEARYPVRGPFAGRDTIPYLLVGKYEVTALQAQAIAAAATGQGCPRARTGQLEPQTGDWWDTLELADRWSQWLAAQAMALPACETGASPCLPQVDGTAAFVRPPTDREWEYAARGGSAVSAQEFGAARYPMTAGLSAHAWYAANADGALQPVGGRAAHPLGLYDLYGNAAEWVFGPGGRPLTVGGHVGSGAAELGADRRWAQPPFGPAAAARNGVRLVASVPLFTTQEKVRDAAAGRVAAAPSLGEQATPPPTEAPARVEAEVKTRAETETKARTETEAEADANARAKAPTARRGPVGTIPEEMVRIPAGSFSMGCQPGEKDCSSDEMDDQKRPHRVQVPAFELGATEVTRAQFGAFVKAKNYRTEAEQGDGCYGLKDGSWTKDKSFNWRNVGFAQGDDSPVVCVTWNDAQRYVGWLRQETGQTWRLPTEAEWEYAARAGTTTAYVWGNDANQGCAYANGYDETGKRVNTFSWENLKCDDGAAQTTTVRNYRPNAFGLYDMSGNVWEWVQDCYHDSYTGAPKDGSEWLGSCRRRVLRGGSWSSIPRDLRTANRTWGVTGNRDDNLGFRVARTLTP